jgi:octaprenyl-diphosphate synthase
VAFQIADDLLDYLGDQAVTGKPGGLDLREHKVTLPLIAALPRVSRAGRARIDELFATEEPPDELIADAVAIVAEAGGIEYARQRGEQFADDARRALRVLPESPVRTSLTDAIAYVMDRQS